LKDLKAKEEEKKNPFLVKNFPAVRGDKTIHCSSCHAPKN